MIGGSKTSAIERARKAKWKHGKRFGTVCPDCQTDMEKYMYCAYTKSQFVREINKNNNLMPKFLPFYTKNNYVYGDWVYKNHKKEFDKAYVKWVRSQIQGR